MCSSVANSDVSPRNWASFRPVPGLWFLGLLFMHMPLFKKTMFFTSCVTIKSPHILRLIIHTVNYQLKAAVVVPDSTSPGFV